VNQTPHFPTDPRGIWSTKPYAFGLGVPGMRRNDTPFQKYGGVCGPLPADGECLCDGTGRVLMQGHHAHTAPCPWCREDDYLADDPDTDHWVIRQCRDCCGAATVDA
jgi:hypothetical protein